MTGIDINFGNNYTTKVCLEYICRLFNIFIWKSYPAELKTLIFFKKKKRLPCQLFCHVQYFIVKRFCSHWMWTAYTLTNPKGRIHFESFSVLSSACFAKNPSPASNALFPSLVFWDQKETSYSDFLWLSTKHQVANSVK